MEVKAPEVAHVHVDGTPEHIKQVKNTQSEVYSSLVADFDGKLRHGKLNSAVLVNYLHQVVRSHKPIHLVRTGGLLRNFPRGNVHAGDGRALAWNERSFSWMHMMRSLRPITGSSIARLLGLSRV